jgi:hypothetical protein
MNELTLNKIKHIETGWICNVFEFDRINTGGLYISLDDFMEMKVKPFDDYIFRLYKKTKKIVINSVNPTDYEYCAIDVFYPLWKCMLCKKICKNTDSKCFCKSYSTCWTPINGEVTGLLFNNDGNFNYHLDKSFLTNLII